MCIKFKQFRTISDFCLLCRAPAGGKALCAECREHLPYLTQACRQCGLPLETGGAARCGECLTSPPAFDRATIPFVYADPIDRLVGDLKFRSQLVAGRVLAQQLAHRIDASGLDLLVPVPLHRARLRERGFNQAAEICRVLAGHTGVPWSSSGLVRTQAAVSQRESNRRERMRNVRHAFAWRGSQACPPRVALVDDVVTTGATLRAAATCLKQAGAAWVEIWAIARTPKA